MGLVCGACIVPIVYAVLLQIYYHYSNIDIQIYYVLFLSNLDGQVTQTFDL